MIAVVLALLMVLVAQRLEDVWWWAWAFVVLEAGTGTVFFLHALLGLPDGVAAWSWWVLACVNGAMAALLLVGLGARRPGEAVRLTRSGYAEPRATRNPRFPRDDAGSVPLRAETRYRRQ